MTVSELANVTDDLLLEILRQVDELGETGVCEKPLFRSIIKDTPH